MQQQMFAASTRSSTSPRGGHRRRHRQGRCPARRHQRRPGAGCRLGGPSCRTRAGGAADLIALDAGGAGPARPHRRRASALWSPHAARIHPVSWCGGSPPPSSASASPSTRHRGDRDRALPGPSPSTAPSAARTSCGRLEGFTAGLAGAPPGLAADEHLHGGHRAAARRRCGRRSAGTARSSSATRRTPTCYVQRTADGRIAIGGRGVPYRFGSRTDDDGAHPAVDRRGAARRSCTSTSPPPPGVPLEHAWSGVLGVPRDWCATVRPWTARPAWAGRAATSGTASPSTNLAGRHDARPRAGPGHRSDRASPGSDRRVRALGAGAAALARRPRSSTSPTGPPTGTRRGARAVPPHRRPRRPDQRPLTRPALTAGRPLTIRSLIRTGADRRPVGAGSHASSVAAATKTPHRPPGRRLGCPHALDVPHRGADARQRPAGRRQLGPRRPDRRREPLVRRRIAPRADRA